ncbi:MAG: hypothetical protein WC378_09990 [Opitutaceae bacterium]|jgi:hypothetical protein
MPEDPTTTPQLTASSHRGGVLSWSFLFSHKWHLAVAFCVAAFLIQIASLYSPATGFTSLIAIGDKAQIGRSLRETEPYIYRKSFGYDGQAYVQIALHPLLEILNSAPASTICPTVPVASCSPGRPGSAAWVSLSGWCRLMPSSMSSPGSPRDGCC